MTDDIGIALLSDLLEGQPEGLVSTALHQGGGPHQRLADRLQGQVGDHVTGEVGLEEGKAKLGTDLEQAERGIVMSCHLCKNHSGSKNKVLLRCRLITVESLVNWKHSNIQGLSSLLRSNTPAHSFDTNVNTLSRIVLL